VRRAAFVIALAASVAAAPAARSADKPPCAQFSWSFDQEKEWFAGKIETTRSGASIAGLSDGALAVELVPASTLSFLLPPENPPKDQSSNGAIVTYAKAQSGRYQVTLSDEAWIDMIQDKAYRPSAEHTGAHGCPGLRKSVRFDLIDGPLTIQLSGASAAKLDIAIRRLD